MNPDPVILEAAGRERERARQAVAARQEQLHRAAVARRRKAKRGGRR